MVHNNVQEFYTGSSGERYFRHRRRRYDLSAQGYSALQFAPAIDANDTVLDFGCGTGGILSHIACGRRIGIEVNESSCRLARAAGIEVHHSIDDIPSACIDVVITHHALEHLAQPLVAISEFLRVLKPGGRLIIVVPCEPGRRTPFSAWRPNPDLHLYSWNPLSLGNLVTACGFIVSKTGVTTAGYSRFNRWLVPVRPLFATAEWLFAYALGRFNTVCFASKPSANGGAE